MSTKIIVDSTTDVSKHIEERLIVVPLTIRFGEEEYTDRVTINHKEFYEKLIETDILPTTSQATPFDFEKVYEEVTSSGDDAVVITLSSKLSGTYQSATIAAEDFEGKIYVVDSDSVTLGAGILTEYALRLADNGMGAKEIADELNVAKERIRLIAMVDTLEYLQKGGRISKAAAIAGTLLSIKPVISVDKGVINVIGKARGSKQANNLLVKEIEQSGGVDYSMPVLLGYTGLSDVLLEKYIKDSAALWEDNVEELHSTVVGSVVGTHAGPGAIAAAYFKK